MTAARRGGPRPRAKTPTKAPTIFDVAEAAGVSKSTVSNVVRGAEQVADGTRERVLAAIERLNYKPNAIARHFVQQRTTILGVLVGDLSNPYYAQMAQVVERAAFGFGYATMFCTIEGAQEIAVAGIDALLEHRVAGIVFLAFIARTPQLGDALERAGAPIVFLGLSEQRGDSVGPRDRRADGSRPSTCSDSATAGSPTSAPRWSSTAAIAPVTPATARRCAAPGCRRSPPLPGRRARNRSASAASSYRCETRSAGARRPRRSSSPTTSARSR